MQIAKQRWTAKELLQTEFPELDWIVPDILPEGFSILGGRPKVGKSWLAMQIAQAVATDGIVFGRKVKAGKVLYLALEDNPRRLSRRIKVQHWNKTNECVFYNTWKPLNEGGLEDLEAEFDKQPYRLCVIDTVTRAFRIKDHNDSGQVTKAYDATQKLFERKRVSLLALDHHSKSAGGMEFDVIDAIISSTAKVAVPDTIMGLAKQRGKKEARFCVTGRDAEDFDEQVVMDSLTMCWQLASTFVKPNTVQSDILKVVRGSRTPLSLATLSEKLKKNKGQIYRECNELVKKELLIEQRAEGQTYYVAEPLSA